MLSWTQGFGVVAIICCTWCCGVRNVGCEGQVVTMCGAESSLRRGEGPAVIAHHISVLTF